MQRPFCAQRFTERLESVRKDSECVFGIMKKRFRILRLPFEYKNSADIDAVMYTCAALHNMLLKYDGRADLGMDDSEHWIKADIAMDDFRINRDRGRE